MSVYDKQAEYYEQLIDFGFADEEADAMTDELGAKLRGLKVEVDKPAPDDLPSAAFWLKVYNALGHSTHAQAGPLMDQLHNWVEKRFGAEVWLQDDDEEE